MKNAKLKPKRPKEQKTVEDARRTFAESASAITSVHVVTLQHVWEAVAINFDQIEALLAAGKNWDEIADLLGPACGFGKVSAQSLRVYRSKLKCGDYDAKLARIGLRRVGSRIVPIAEEGEAGDARPRNPVANAASLGSALQRAPQHRPVRQPPHEDTTDETTEATPSRLR